MTVQIERTRQGLPALWEWGGGHTNIGDACIVAGKRGEPLRPIYIRRKGHRACAEHALFVVKEGYVLVRAARTRNEWEIQVYRISQIDREQATLEEVYSFSKGEWTPEPPKGALVEAVQAAKEKAACYHCREPHYLRLPEPQEEGVVM